MVQRWLVACVIVMWLMGCGGGGSGDSLSGSDGVDRELERAMVFHDEALRVTQAHIDVTCERVACPWSEGGPAVREGADQEQSVCGHACVVVALPGEAPGEVETRYFLVEHAYVRPVDGCYTEPEVAFAIPHLTPCLDHSF